MGIFDTIASYLVPDVYADNQAQPQEESSKAYGDSHQADPSEDQARPLEDNKSVQSTPKETDSTPGDTDDEGGEEKEEGGEGEEEEAAEEPEEEEEEEEEEPVDPMPTLQEQCAKTPECRPHKHEYDECVARVTAAAEDENHHGHKEDCVEEFFELTHCVAQCAAPKLFKRLA